jgi:hypothetical protein
MHEQGATELPPSPVDSLHGQTASIQTISASDTAKQRSLVINQSFCHGLERRGNVCRGFGACLRAKRARVNKLPSEGKRSAAGEPPRTALSAFSRAPALRASLNKQPRKAQHRTCAWSVGTLASMSALVPIKSFGTPGCGAGKHSQSTNQHLRCDRRCQNTLALRSTSCNHTSTCSNVS